MPAVDLNTAVAQAITDSNLLHTVVHGSNVTTVTTEGGPVPSVAKAIADIASAIITGNASGFVAVAANNAARLAATPAQIDQLLIQTDTKAIYYAPSLTTGSWIFHPVQNAAADAATAVAAVATLTTALGAKMDTATYVGGGASGVVRTAEHVKDIADLAASVVDSALNLYGVENSVTTIFPVLQNNRAKKLVDGLAEHTNLANCSRRCQGIGENFVFVNNPQRLVSWGRQKNGGTLGSGLRTTTESYFPRSIVSVQQSDRNLPGFNSRAIYTSAGQIERVSVQGAAVVALTNDGTVLVAGSNAQGVKCLFGSGVDKLQSAMMPIFFDTGSGNAPIKAFDVQDSTTLATISCGVFVDTSDGVWIVSTNTLNSGYGNSLSGAINTPVLLNPGYPGWSTHVVKKVRCDTTGGVYVLFTNGDLYIGGGSNATGRFGTGGTGTVGNLFLGATAVDDFEVSGCESGNTLALWILQGTTLKAAGYNINGQMGQGTSYTNKTSFVTVTTDAQGIIRLGGTGSVTLIYQASGGAWYGLGRNTDGAFGNGANTTSNGTPVLLTDLATLIAGNGSLVELCISGYANLHATCAVMSNGRAFTTGNNTDGCLANGTTVNSNQWTEVLWAPRDSSEKIIDVSAAVGVNSGPAFTWMTNHGRVLMSGSTAHGFSTGVVTTAAYTVCVASPVQLGTL